jgi:hypothetical protein
MKPGDQVFYLTEYNWHLAEVVKVNRVNIRIRDRIYNEERDIKPEKIAQPDEIVCVVWECWKGRNGRGGYRVERTLYPESRIPAREVARQGWLTGAGRVVEKAYGQKETH